MPPRTCAVAVATCAAASLAGRSGAAGDEPASVQAAVQLARHAALDSHAALSARRARRAHRLLARAGRRLAYSHALAARVLADHEPASSTAGAFFIQAASEVAHDSAALARRAEGRLRAHALRTLWRLSRLEEDVALELSSARSAGSIADLIDALSAAVRAQDALLAALDEAPPNISRRDRRALEDGRTRAIATRDALHAALTVSRDAVQDPPVDISTGGDAAAGGESTEAGAPAQKGSASDAGRDDRSHPS